MNDKHKRTFAQEKEIMQMFIDSAKTYTQMSAGTLALSMVFIEKLLGKSPPIKVDSLLAASWLLLLGSIFISAAYQYLAVKYVDSHSADHGAKGIAGEYFIENPGIAYGLMVFAFVFGAALLVAEVILTRQ